MLLYFQQNVALAFLSAIVLGKHTERFNSLTVLLFCKDCAMQIMSSGTSGKTEHLFSLVG